MTETPLLLIRCVVLKASTVPSLFSLLLPVPRDPSKQIHNDERLPTKEARYELESELVLWGAQTDADPGFNIHSRMSVLFPDIQLDVPDELDLTQYKVCHETDVGPFAPAYIFLILVNSLIGQGPSAWRGRASRGGRAGARRCVATGNGRPCSFHVISLVPHATFLNS